MCEVHIGLRNHHSNFSARKSHAKLTDVNLNDPNQSFPLVVFPTTLACTVANNPKTDLNELPLLAGPRPQSRPAKRSSNFSLLGHLKGVINLDAEVANGTFELGVFE